MVSFPNSAENTHSNPAGTEDTRQMEQTAASAEEISSITQEQTATLEEISAGSQILAKIAEGLNKQVTIFKI